MLGAASPVALLGVTAVLFVGKPSLSDGLKLNSPGFKAEAAGANTDAGIAFKTAGTATGTGVDAACKSTIGVAIEADAGLAFGDVSDAPIATGVDALFGIAPEPACGTGFVAASGTAARAALGVGVGDGVKDGVGASRFGEVPLRPPDC